MDQKQRLAPSAIGSSGSTLSPRGLARCSNAPEPATRNTATERQRASPSNFEPLVAHRLVGLKFAGCALEYYPSVTHHIDTVGYPQGDRQLLFDQQDRDAAPGNFGDQVADLLNNDRRQPFGGLVDHNEFGVAH